MDAWKWIAISIAIPLLLNELGELSPWLAQKIVKYGSRMITDPVERAIRCNEWQAGLHEVPGKLTKLADAVGLIVFYVPRTWVRFGFPFGPRHRSRSRVFDAFKGKLAHNIVMSDCDCHWSTKVYYDTDGGPIIKGRPTVTIHNYAIYEHHSFYVTFENNKDTVMFYEMTLRALNGNFRELVRPFADRSHEFLVAHHVTEWRFRSGTVHFFVNGD